MKLLSLCKVARLVAVGCVAALLGVTLQNCTKAPLPAETDAQLRSSIMPPMSGTGPYAAQLTVWRAYTNSFGEFYNQHRNAEMLTVDMTKGVSSIRNIVIMQFDNAAKALFKLDSLFVENIGTMTNGSKPAATLTEIVPVQFPTYTGLGIFLNYMNSWGSFRPQINAIIKNADTQTAEGKELKAAAEDFVTKVNTCTSTMYQLR
jgi:hypothetical protein